MKKETIEFSIEADTRHPQDLDAYESITHRYLPEYVNPSGWDLHLEIGTMPPPEEIKAYQWSIERVDNDFAHTITHEQQTSKVTDATVSVPDQGHYQVTLTITMKNGRSYSKQRDFFLRDYLIVCIGDSYFCGEGNPDTPAKHTNISGTLACNLATFTKFLVEKINLKVPLEREPVWQEEKAHRSYQSGPSLAARELVEPAYGNIVTFLNFARSGSSVEEGLLAPLQGDDWTEIGQIEEVKRTVGDRPIDALLISTGGNDIRFSERLLDLLREDLVLVGTGHILGDDQLNRQEELEEALRQLKKLPQRLDRLAEGVAELNADEVYLMEYPTGHFDKVAEDGTVVAEAGCGIFEGPDMDIDARDAQVIKQTAEKLNKVLRQASQKHSWIFVTGVAEAFAGHGRCSNEKFFLSAEESCRIQGDFQGTMHPNRKGHAAYSRCIQRAIKQYTMRARDIGSE